MRFAVAIVSSPSHHDIGGEALNEVAEALHHALLAHGHDSVLTNRFHLDDRRTIVLGANLPVQTGWPATPPVPPAPPARFEGVTAGIARENRAHLPNTQIGHSHNRATGEGTVPKLDRDFTRGGHVIGVFR
ncbi:hypothetical protein, partial [Mycobacterium sp. E796]|uniref:hypothetical protein n=1 Tax=Mycobacterium sp. E796 TaxID=1834151 RepID=UPI0018D325F2